MKNIKALLKLDLLLVTPYWKWWAMFLGISLFMSIINQDGGIFILFVAMFAMTVMAFPFEVTDKSNLDVLYATLPTNRKSMVVARYGFMLLSLVAMMLLAIPIGMIIHVAFGNTVVFTSFMIITCFSMAVYSICVSFQTPFMYKHGYKKGRIFMWVPITVFIIIFNLQAFFDLANWDVSFNLFEILFRNTVATILVSLAVGILSFVLSFYLSCKIYLKKDI